MKKNNNYFRLHRSRRHEPKTINLAMNEKSRYYECYVLFKIFVWRSKTKHFEKLLCEPASNYLFEMDPEAIAADNNRHSFGKSEVISSIANPTVKSNELSVDA